MTIEEALEIAVQHHRAGQLHEAERIYAQILQVAPGHARTLYLVGMIAHERARFEDALEYVGRAAGLDPEQADFHHALGRIYRKLGKMPEAIASYRRALALSPQSAEAHNNLGIVWKEERRLDEAIACYRQALRLKPDLAQAHNNLGNALQEQGKLDEAIASYRRALELKPDYAPAHGNLLYTLQYRAGVPLAELSVAHAEFERRHAAPLRAAWRAHDNRPDPERLLRLAFVSPDFRRHPIGYFLVRVLENLDRAQCDVVCYSDCTAPDDMTSRFQSAATAWKNVCATTDERLAEQIRADRIDILFDLAGHTSRNRLLVFARKPAPIQVTWAGYVGTTGLAAIDYILADRHEIPFEAEPHYIERVLRMPHGYVCFDPPDEAPPVGPLPGLAAGHVTFGSFNNPAKITPQVVACWSEILRRVPLARLILKYRCLDDPGTADVFRGLFAKEEIAAGRVELQGWSPFAELLAHYQQVDLALDTFPYNGGLTTCEALWMGVPVVTCPGETFASRHSLSHLSNVGLTDTIASNFDQYVDMAVALAQDLPRLAAIRAGLRQQVAESPLCDGRRFAEDLLGILRGAWREWVRSERNRRRHPTSRRERL